LTDKERRLFTVAIKTLNAIGYLQGHRALDNEKFKLDLGVQTSSATAEIARYADVGAYSLSL